MTTDEEEIFPPIEPDDPEVLRHYLGQLRWRHPEEARAVDAGALERAVHEGLRLCGPLRINDPKEILHFLALILLLTPAQKASALHTTVVYRVLLQLSIWGARKRMRFIYRFVVGRPAPDPEPDFGVWFIADPNACPVSLEDVRKVLFTALPPAAPLVS
jgi:hypothetical protein